MSTHGAEQTILVLRQAMDVIRRESLKSPIETGGILVGTRSESGHVLITHASPPGPKAVHNAVYFKRDVQFQQVFLDDLHRRFGARYLGEWHKHPRGMPYPSSGDLGGVRAILDDPDYGVDALLFPIVICEPDLGFQLHPFVATADGGGVAMEPAVWHEMELGMDPDRVFTRPAASVPVTEAEPDPEPAPAPRPAPQPDPEPAPEPEQSGWQKLAGWLPFLSGEQKDRVEEEPESASAPIPMPVVAPAAHWYETADGRRVLAEEQRLLRSFGLESNPFLSGDDDLCFAFPRTGEREVVIACSRSHPEAAPTVLIRDGTSTSLRPGPSIEWSTGRMLVDVLVPLLGPEVATRKPSTPDETSREGEPTT